MGRLSQSLHSFLTSSQGWSPLKKVCVNCTVGILAVFFVFAAGEVGLRLYHRVKYDDIHISVSSIKLDEEIGWVPNPSYNFHGIKHDAAGLDYHADVHQGHEDFRIFGDTGSNDRKKVLFLGDSFTHAVEVDDDSTFYSIVSRDLALEPFVLGVGGYSNLQEYLMLKKHVGEIAPDIVILQFCSNDFINNHYELELCSTVANNGLRRPYMSAGGEIFYAIPKKFSFFRDFVIKHSRLVYYVLSRLDMLSACRESIEDEIREKGLAVKAFRESIAITEGLIKAIRDCLPPGTSLYVFCVDEDEPFFGQMKQILSKNDIPFIEGVSRELVKAETSGTGIRAADRMHWNQLGHIIVAREMERYLAPAL